jgi:MoxR-like ATPase
MKAADGALLAEKIRGAVRAAVVGRETAVDQILVGLLADGHLLLEDMPGLGKTLMAKSFAAALGLDFQRVQFTADLLPHDITGAEILDPKTGAFVFRPGPIFSNVLLADEINRAPPKVQSALLEAMQERQVTVDGVGYPLPKPFIVIATENPIEQEGTYPLPEAELDRFLFRILMGYPSAVDERTLLERHTGSSIPEPKDLHLDAEALERLRKDAVNVTMTPEVLDFVMRTVRSTRNDPKILMGASPRAGVQFLRATKAAALLAGRSFVTPGDVRSVGFDVLNHRILLHPDLLAQRYVTGANGVEPLLREVLDKRLDEVRAPR